MRIQAPCSVESSAPTWDPSLRGSEIERDALALCVVGEGRSRIVDVAAARTWQGIDEIIADWVTSPTLIALDAPLG